MTVGTLQSLADEVGLMTMRVVEVDLKRGLFVYTTDDGDGVERCTESVVAFLRNVADMMADAGWAKTAPRAADGFDGSTFVRGVR